MKKNCWEFKNCGRETGGAKVKELGECIAAKEVRSDGINSGSNGGRACWAISGTLCGGKVQGTFAMKVANCINCEFYKLVVKEEGTNFQNAIVILEKLKK